jgi:hypothetical protein
MVAKLTRSLGALLLAGIPIAALSQPVLPKSKSITTAPATHRYATIENNASCDIGTYPAATLLLPYFEVELGKPENQASNTIFTVVNTSRLPQITRVTIWTDYGYPTIWFNVFLTGYDAQSFNMYDLLANGSSPRTSANDHVGDRSLSTNSQHVSLDACGNLGGQLTQDALTEVQTALTTGRPSAAALNGCKVGGEHPTLAVGYVTVDVVNSCSSVSPLDSAYYSQVLLFDNVLTGDYERFNPDPTVGNYAGGNPLVHIKAVPEGGKAGSIIPAGNSLPYTFYDRFTPQAARRIDRRQPLPAAFAARFIEGGTANFATDYAIWREGMDHLGPGGCNVSASSAMPYGSIIRFDEMENPTVAALAPGKSGTSLLTFPATSAKSTASSAFPPRVSSSVTGWMYLNLDNAAGASASASSPYSLARPSQNWVIVHLRADGRYAVDYDATTISNGCTYSQTEVK